MSNGKEFDITNSFLNLSEIPKIGLFILLNEESKKVYVTYTLNSTEIIKRFVERKRNLDMTKDLLNDLDSRNTKVIIKPVDNDILSNTDALEDSLRFLVSDALSKYQENGYTPYSFQYNTTKYEPKIYPDDDYNFNVCLVSTRRTLFIKSFQDKRQAIEFIAYTSILSMIRIFYMNRSGR